VVRSARPGFESGTMTDTGSEHLHFLDLQALVIEFHRAGNNGCAPIEMIVSVLS